MVKELKAEAESNGEWTKLAETLASVFSHSEYLGSSFLLVIKDTLELLAFQTPNISLNL